MDAIDLTFLSVIASCLGMFFFLQFFRVRPSESWESSSAWLKTILFFCGALFQIPVLLCIWFKPDVVMNTLSVERWTFANLLLNYLYCGIFAAVVKLLVRIFG